MRGFEGRPTGCHRKERQAGQGQSILEDQDNKDRTKVIPFFAETARVGEGSNVAPIGREGILGRARQAGDAGKPGQQGQDISGSQPAKDDLAAHSIHPRQDKRPRSHSDQLPAWVAQRYATHLENRRELRTIRQSGKSATGGVFCGCEHCLDAPLAQCPEGPLAAEFAVALLWEAEQTPWVVAKYGKEAGQGREELPVRQDPTR